MSNPSSIPNPERPLERVDTATVIQSLKARERAQRNRSASRRRKNATGMWQTGLFGCCGKGMVDANCIAFIAYSTCAPCLFGTAMEAAKLSKAVAGDALGNKCYYPLMACDGWTSCACCACPCCIQYMARTRVAQKYHIAEGMAYTLFATCCCTCCSYVQVVNHVLASEHKVFTDLYGSFKLVDARAAKYDSAPMVLQFEPPKALMKPIKVPKLGSMERGETGLRYD